MAVSSYREVVFGIGGLTTVGYRLFEPDGDPVGARITSGITERGTNTGIYGALVSLPDDFEGEIRWDTGGGSPIYASEDIHALPAPVVMNAGIVESSSSPTEMNVEIIENADPPIQINVEIIENP